MTLSNRQLFLKYVGQTSGHPLQLEIERAEGIYFYTPGGKRYIDLVSGVSVSSLGHNHPAIIEAVKSQVDKHMHLMVYGEFVQSTQVKYAAWLSGHLPDDLDVVYYVNSGSEAIEGAMKLAKRYTGRPEILAFNKAYHGSTHGALSILGDKKFHAGFLPLLPGINHAEFNDPAALEMITENTAAVVVEPIQAEAGIIEPHEGFLKKLREKCDQTGTLLVLDEIQTGFGRTGKLFAFEHYEIVPDIICFAKSFGGGMPLGAFVSSGEKMRSLTQNPELGHITTFGGHPVSCAAGLAAQKFVEKNQLIAHAKVMGELYKELMVHDGICEVRGKGLFLAVEFNNTISGKRLMENIFANGIILDQFLFCDNAFRIAPPFIITEEEVRNSASLLLDAIESSRI
ncbi:MAG: aspartate aminotransferase family protein [Bacteroidales bacterium]